MKAREFTAIPDLGARADQAITDLTKCVRETLERFPDGLRNVEVAKLLGLHVPHGTSHRNYLTHFILDRMVRNGEATISEDEPKTYRLN